MTVRELLRRCRGEAVYVEFQNVPDVEAVRRAIEDTGARVWDIDEDVDIEHFPLGGICRAAAVFRYAPGNAHPASVLAAAASLPCVFSVSE